MARDASPRTGATFAEPEARHDSGPRSGAAAAIAAYLLLAVGFTWPLARGLSRDIPWDLGDSLLNCWILGWGADHVVRFLGGELGALDGFWSGNIFYPEPLTLAYSDHLFAQVVQILPVFAVTRNLILCYNLLFLSTFVLSGLGAFLLVRELTGSARAGFVAGLIYAFAPLRVPQFSHVQVLSSQWMPFVLYGFRRYFATRRVGPLAGGAAALVAQNLSSGYYLLFFAPFVAAYVLFEIASRKLWRDASMWLSIAAAAAIVAVATLPFLLPYLELRRLGFPPRDLREVESYSADVYSYLTAPAESRLWGRVLRVFPKPEAELFPSFAALLLGAAGLIASLRSAQHPSGAAPALGRPWALVYTAFGLFTLYALLSLVILTGYGFSSLGPVPISAQSLSRSLVFAAMALALLLLVSPRARSFVWAWLCTPYAFCALAAAAAFALSLGPTVRTLGRAVRAAGPYALLFAQVPGYDGLRVPARFGMLVMLFLAVLAGFGAASLERRWKHGGAIALVCGLFVLVEASAAPIGLNGSDTPPGYAMPPPRVFTGNQVPAVYHFLRTLPGHVVAAEFPLGEWTYELRYVYYSTEHWRPLINGYSGTFPLSYHLRAEVLRRPELEPDRAWQALLDAGVTHAVVHEDAYNGGNGKVVGAWLAARGARRVAEFGGDKVYRIARE